MIITEFNSARWLLFWGIGLLLIMTLACTREHTPNQAALADAQNLSNPAAPGFDTIHSQAAAIEIADQVMEAMGGRQAWDQTRFIAWNFFGNRKLIWDRYTGNTRIDFPDSSVYLVNVNHMTGKVKRHGEQVTHPDSLSKYLEQGKNLWINDSYWLVMPFKLKDSGVTLKYLGDEPTLEGKTSHVLELTFKGVGVTPQNKYLVYVDTGSNLVNQWAYYREAGQDSANFVLPWGNYQIHGKILLSDDRGNRDLSEVQVFDALPEEVFTSFEPVNLSLYH